MDTVQTLQSKNSSLCRKGRKTGDREPHQQKLPGRDSHAEFLKSSGEQKWAVKASSECCWTTRYTWGPTAHGCFMCFLCFHEQWSPESVCSVPWCKTTVALSSLESARKDLLSDCIQRHPDWPGHFELVCAMRREVSLKTRWAFAHRHVSKCSEAGVAGREIVT